MYIHSLALVTFLNYMYMCTCTCGAGGYCYTCTLDKHMYKANTYYLII
jgi:hypothetical protein